MSVGLVLETAPANMAAQRWILEGSLPSAEATGVNMTS